MTRPSMQRTPNDLAWTPLEHPCGCVTDWGFSAKQLAPPTFMSWCINVVNENCPWHGGETGQLPQLPEDEMIALNNPNGSTLYARRATGDDVALGRRLAGELRDLMDKATNDKLALMKEIPLKYRKWLYSKGYDPLEAWLDQRLTDIILNRGTPAVSPEFLNQALD